MAEIQEQLDVFSDIAKNPGKQLDKYVKAGKRVIGVMPYYLPEELVDAAGAVSFGVWGTQGSADEARKYFPPFYCSLCQMSLEMGLNHSLDKLSGLMSSALCDTLKCFTQNWQAGNGQRVPLIFVSQPQNRFSAAGLQYAIDSYTEVKRKVQECCGAIIEDDALSASIKLYNKWRKAMRKFVVLAGQHPALVSVPQRAAVIESSYFMTKAEHLDLVQKLNASLEAEDSDMGDFSPVVLSGIFESIPDIQSMLQDNKISVVADDLAKESRTFAMNVPEDGDPIAALAAGFCGMGNDSILYDPKKNHIEHVVSLAKENKAKGVIILLAKFCDPEEFDAPMIMSACKEAGIPCITVEIDQSTETYEQARTQFETFKDLLK